MHIEYSGIRIVVLYEVTCKPWHVKLGSELKLGWRFRVRVRIRL